MTPDTFTTLVTGGGGFIGSHLVRRLSRRRTVRVLDNFSQGKRSNLRGLNVEILEGSILDRDLVATAMKGVRAVVHLAGMVSVADSMSRPAFCVEQNVNGTLNVLAVAADAGVESLVFASSASVYGETPEAVKTEALSPDPRSPYAVSKLDGEYYCRMFSTMHGFRTVCLRFFNAFGAGQDPNGPYASAIPAFVRRAVRGEPITIFGDGGQTRDFVHVSDIAAAIEFGLGKRDLQGVFNVGVGATMSVLDLARLVVELAGSDSEIRFGPARAGDVRNSCADVSRLAGAGWKAMGDLATGLKELIAIEKDSLAQVAG